MSKEDKNPTPEPVTETTATPVEANETLVTETKPKKPWYRKIAMPAILAGFALTGAVIGSWLASPPPADPDDSPEVEPVDSDTTDPALDPES